MKRTAYGEQTTLSDRRRRAGQRLIVGLPGPTIGDELRWLCAETAPAGFILFGRNIEEPAQVRELNRELASLLPDRLPPLLTLDQEGGRVQRLRGTPWPPARWLGNLDEPATTRRVAAAMGHELRAAGFNLTWAPVADVAEGPADGVIGDRSFSADPDRAARHVVAALAGLADAGILGAAKHFPGHGAATVDSHEALPVVELEPPELERRDLTPFRAAVQAGVGLVMAAHVCYPAWDEEQPASLSHRILTGILRNKLGYDGLIVTDDLEMGALSRWSPEERVFMAVDAGVDLLLICHSTTEPLRAYEQLVRLQEQDPIPQDRRAIDTEKRLVRLRVSAWSEPLPPAPLSLLGSPAHRDLALLVQARGGG